VEDPHSAKRAETAHHRDLEKLVVQRIEMTLAEKLVTACIGELRKNEVFAAWWRSERRAKQGIMNDLRREVQYVLDRELLAQMGQPEVRVADNSTVIQDLIDKMKPPEDERRGETVVRDTEE